MAHFYIGKHKYTCAKESMGINDIIFVYSRLYSTMLERLKLTAIMSSYKCRDDIADNEGTNETVCDLAATHVETMSSFSHLQT